MIFVEEAYGHSSLWVINKSAYQIALFLNWQAYLLALHNFQRKAFSVQGQLEQKGTSLLFSCHLSEL